MPDIKDNAVAFDVARMTVLYAAWGCAVASILHIVTIIAGPAWFDFLGAPPHYGQMMRDGDYFLPVTVTVFIAGVLAVWSAYAFCAAGVIRRLPFARLICGAVALIFILRGLFVFPLIGYVMSESAVGGVTPKSVFHIAASLFILTLGSGFANAVRILGPVKRGAKDNS